MTPSISASKRTERLTCLRLAPSARSRPSSRVRWATSIWKVLTIRNAPTISEIPAKPSITYFMKPMKPTLLRPSASCSARVFTS